MTYKSFIFALALLQVISAQDELSALSNEEDYEIALSAEELLEQNTAEDIHSRRYFASDGYQAKCSQEKMDLLWQMLVPDATNHSVPVTDFMWRKADNFFVQKANGPFCDASDELRTKRPKTTHTQGIVAQVEWKSTSDRFSGFYAKDTTALLRFSQTANLHENSLGLMPSMALKFLITGKKSENLFGMPNFTGEYTNEATGEKYHSWNFFEKKFKSRVARFEDDGCMREAKEEKMLEGSDKPYATSVSRPSFYTTTIDPETGAEIHTVPETKAEMRDRSMYQFPFQLEYEGVPYFNSENEGDDWHVAMRDYFNAQCVDTDNDGFCENEGGVKVLDVYAWTAPEGEVDLNGNAREYLKIGEINLKTKLYTSEAGDQRLFFQHIRMNKDYRVWPREWKNEPMHDFQGIRDDPVYPGIEGLTKNGEGWPWPFNNEDAKAMYMELEAAGCPFSWLF